jgi:hypothetical protein
MALRRGFFDRSPVEKIIGFDSSRPRGGSGRERRPRPQAETHTESARDFIMHELVTKADLALALENQTHRLTIRLGSMIGAGIAALIVLQCFH